MASKRGNRPGKIKDIKAKKVGTEKAQQVKGGALITVEKSLLADPRPDPAKWYGPQVFKKGY